MGLGGWASGAEAGYLVQPGDVLLMFTDGLTEAASPSGEFYRLRRVAAVLSVGPNRVDSIAEGVLQDVGRFTARDTFSDDLTLICFGRES